ncbi:cytochrome c oxidase subunit II [Rhizobium sp. L9]|uniref:cytochrome c oxidase subunit II n=1 Tax=Rhizobium TaxID=379 RepID=UPI000BEA1C38|nr:MULTISPECIES: cytochrome c oxidase subunit II [Rhizobium]MBB3354120.1 cytochrome c oxidase subunit 2 [Rhizobium sp. BK049]MBX5135585.1 cytochrome c oxidase subunit II [Rhizobium lentis]MBX5141513.1 cytochrome c oxidase subunit II [Rhizobium lentis]MBX5153672.1 cytochrome c oxidase subunit II [Rhizobium lentis]PDT28462.1 cytochrome c oxidase subunit II [Rhizobium sp. L9]
MKTAPACTLFLSGCAAGTQSALNADGPAASELRSLILLFVAVCGVVFVLVMSGVVWALVRRKNQIPGEPQAERSMARVVAGAIVMTVLVVSFLTITSFYATNGVDRGRDNSPTIAVRGQQWWWQFTYLDADPARTFQTANELHIPVGTDVRLRLDSTDVIHSFWVPNLTGKQDLVPGRDNRLTLHASKAGIYRGQCAEFCGLQHSHMALLVIAEEPEDYARWLELQRKTAAAPADGDAATGKLVFMSKPCAACHTIRGTEASGTSGPDLTHVGSRSMIAAGLLENTRGSVAAWIADPQTLKPGNNMPLVPLTGEELRQVSAYMSGLR